MKKIVFIIFFSSLSLTNLFAANSLSRNLDDFHSIDVFGNIKITLIKGDSTKMMMKSEQYDLSKVTTIVKNGELKIKSSGLGDKNEVYIILYYKNINELTLDAGGNLIKTDTLKSNKFDLKVAKGSLAVAIFEVKELGVIVSNGGEARIYGRTDKITVNSNAGSLLDAYKLQISEADIFATTGGRININVIDKISAKARLGGVINYKGNPKTESVDPSSGGKINKS